MTADLSKFNFYSGVNYMKRDVSIGTTLLTLGGAGTTVTHTVTHSLGYIPFYEVHAEIDNAEIIWNNTKIYYSTDTSSGGGLEPQPALYSWITTTTLTISLVNQTTPTASGTRRIHWLIYRDYGNI